MASYQTRALMALEDMKMAMEQNRDHYAGTYQEEHYEDCVKFAKQAIDLVYKCY